MKNDKDHFDAVRALGGSVPGKPKWELRAIERLDTIEALQAEIERLNKVIEAEALNYALQHDTIERLREWDRKCQEDIMTLGQEIARLQAENQRLQDFLRQKAIKEIERLRAALKLQESAFDCYVEEQKKDKAEIKRLRAALKQIYDLKAGEMDMAWSIAQDAMGEAGHEPHDIGEVNH